MQTLQTHYYFTDNSHCMDAEVYLNCKSAIYTILKDLAKNYGAEVTIQTIALEEGGIKDTFTITASETKQFIAGCLIAAATYYLTNDPNTTHNQEFELMKNLENSGFDHQTLLEMYPDVDWDRLCKLTQKALNKQNLKRSCSKFYANLSKVEKVSKVSVSNLDKNNKPINEEQKTVYKGQFNNFINKDRVHTTVDYDAVIFLISPVLKPATRYKWKGIYNNGVIEFSIDDENFKNDVYAKRRIFSNDHTLSVELQVTTKYDNEDNIINTSYKVLSVLGGYDAVEEVEYTTLAGEKRQKESFFKGSEQQKFELTLDGGSI